MISTSGPGAIATTALLAPLAMGMAHRANAPMFLTALMVANGANALVLARAGDDTAMLEHVPWAVIVMITGVSVLIGVLEKTGGMDLFNTLPAYLATPNTVNGVIGGITGMISTYSSTSGVVYPAFLPAVPGLVQKLGGGNPLEIAISINVGAALVDVSPLSTIGALFCQFLVPFFVR